MDLFSQPLPDKLPCPFSGSSNLTTLSFSNGYVWCKSCGSSGPIVYEKLADGNELEAKAIKRWNERKVMK